MRSKTPSTAFIGGLGSGKTWVGGAKFVCRAMDPRHRNVVGLIGANSYKQLHKATLATLFEFMESIGVNFRYAKTDRELWIEDRKKPVLCYSMANYDDLRGIKFGFGWLDEIARMKREAFEVVTGRLRDSRGDLGLDLTSTPDGFNWLHDYFVEQVAEKPELAKLRSVVHAITYENHHLPEEYFRQLEATYDELLIKQEVFGEFVNVFAGQAYRTFDRRRCEITGDVAKPHPSAPLDLNIDFNVDPVCVSISQYRRHGRGPDEIVVVDEIVLRNGDTPEVCEEFVRRYPEWKAGVRIFGDAQGLTRAATAGKSDYAIMRELLGKRYRVELHVPKQNPPVIDRVNSVNALFRKAVSSRPDAVIGYVAKGKAPTLVRDLERMAFKPGTRVLDKSDPMLSHSSDGFGYMVHKLARLGRYTGPPARRVVAQYAR